jgi:hypothetical protein
LSADVTREVATVRREADRLCRVLRDRLARFDVSADAAPRMQTANTALAFVEAVAGATPQTLVHVVATAGKGASDAAIASSLRKSEDVATTLEATKWEVFEALGRLSDGRAEAAAAIRVRVGDALSKDEYAVALKPALDAALSDALRLLTETSVPPPPSPKPSPPSPGRRRLETQRQVNLGAAEATRLFEALGARLRKDPTARLDVDWELFRPGGPE